MRQQLDLRARRGMQRCRWAVGRNRRPAKATPATDRDQPCARAALDRLDDIEWGDELPRESDVGAARADHVQEPAALVRTSPNDCPTLSTHAHRIPNTDAVAALS